MKLIIQATALTLGLTLAACGGIPTNRQLNSLNQPVVERTNYTLDLTAGPGGLSYPEQRRLAGWFEAMALRYGDRISIDDPMASEATRAGVAAIAARYGLLLGGQAPVTVGYVNAGTVRVIVTRAKASVPGCPDWGGKNDSNLLNATSPGYGCAVNGNFAAMIANPEHLVKGAEGGSETVIMSSNKAIDVYREATPTGEKGLKTQATSGK
jgi:pilus assembly protein CpaD